MSKSGEARSIIEAAEQAAGAGNYARAEVLLREAALLQEAQSRFASPGSRQYAEQPRRRVRDEWQSGRGGAMSFAEPLPSRRRCWKQTIPSWPRVERTFMISVRPGGNRSSCQRLRRL